MVRRLVERGGGVKGGVSGGAGHWSRVRRSPVRASVKDMDLRFSKTVRGRGFLVRRMVELEDGEEGEGGCFMSGFVENL